MVLNLEQLSNENLVNFYREELKMINLGEPVSTFFSANTIRGLIRKGILKTTHPSPPRRRITISDSTRTLISQAGR